MRRSELLGLRVGRHRPRRRPPCHQSPLVSVAYRLHDTPGKTRSSRQLRRPRHRHRRKFCAPGTTARSSKAGRQVGDDDRVFWHAERCRDPDVFSQTFNRIVATGGVPRLRLHDLRHTHASLMLKESVPIKVVSERLGHSTPASPWPPTSTCCPACKPTHGTTFRPASSLHRLQPGRRPGRRQDRRRKTLAEQRSDQGHWWRGRDLNPRPSGYEPDELPDCSTPRRTRHVTSGTEVGQPSEIGQAEAPDRVVLVVDVVVVVSDGALPLRICCACSVLRRASSIFSLYVARSPCFSALFASW